MQARMLLLGCDGQVGWELQRTLACLGEVTSTSLCGRYGLALDLLDRDAVASAVRRHRPDFIINAAAHTAVDKAESEIELSARLNAEAPGLLGSLAAEQGATLIHYSTDFVFAGDADRPYQEEDAASPVSVYGQTKLEGEQRLLATGADTLIFRTSWVYGNHGHNFMNTMLRLFKERDCLRVVDDQIGAPTWSRMIAEVTAQVVNRLGFAPSDSAHLRGIYHLTAGGETSWCGFAQRILELSGEACRIDPILTRDYPTPARRPAYSVLDNTKLNKTFGIKLPDWKLSLAQCLADRLARMKYLG
ncbi:MAG: dTDP-4-dehydrorhamnose reductase [Candidatus Thiodiazotropha sp. (ex Epidulcina cf. delphinae)]|nr:dTDP-4-dehydrorhamnose reductase [Candidatus Thiodiazotropha sp. (ex Epidulcina cf. delphinae)]